jgi:phage shock protein E
MDQTRIKEPDMLKKLFVLAAITLSCAAASAKTVLIDVRTPEEFSAGHLDGALNIDYQVIDKRIGMSGAGKEDEVILYCQSGRRAGIALDSLKGMGYKKVSNYGGIDDARKKLQKK